MSKYWTKTDFWGKVRDTFALVSMPAVGTLEIIGTKPGWIIFTCVIGFLGSVVGIWFTDKDNDGTVDAFQK